MYRFLTFTLLMVTWLVFSGKFDVFHVGLGVLSAAFVTWISSDFLFENRKRTAGERVLEAMRFPPYLAWLVWQVALANIHILKLALSPIGMREVEPRTVRYRVAPGMSNFEKFVLAQSITLTPGTVTIRVEGDVFLIHAISKTAAEGLDGSMARKISELYGKVEPVAGGDQL